MRRNRIAAAAAGLTLAFTLAACGGSGAGGAADATEADAGGGDGDTMVGVSMPTQTYERWVTDGNAVQSGLEEAGYEVSLTYANDDIPTQQQQIAQMITQGADLLIIASIDGTALSSQLDAAAAQDIPVISYDRLIRDNKNVDFYVTFDNQNVGVQQANSLLTGLGILDENGEKTGETGPFNIELFAGSLDDNNAHYFWSGAMSVLQPYIDDGTLVVPSGQVDIEQAAIQRWEQEAAQTRMEDLLTSAYTGDTELDGVLAPSDPLARGIITALQNRGFGPTLEDGLPIVTGQDAEIASIKLISDGVQYSTIFKDTRKLADRAVESAESILAGEEPEANDTETYDNGVKVVPSYLLEVSTVTSDNIQEELVATDYYTEEQIESGQL